MSKVESHRTLVAGILSPFLAAALGQVAYQTLTRASTDRDADFVFRLSVTALAMTVPFVITAFMAMSDRRRAAFGTPAKIGLSLAMLSLSLTFFPIRGVVQRARQAANLARSDVAAPPFDTVDIHGTPQRLADHRGDVVLINVWATWCLPCRKEMPDLEKLFQSRKDDGLMIFGLSIEDIDTQLKFTKEVKVSYPLLTTDGDVPKLFSDTARYPANFLVDRDGNLQPAPSVDQPFENLVAAVDALLEKPKTSY